MARSLLDDPGFGSIGRRSARPPRRASRERVKAVLAVFTLALAGGILAWHYGVVTPSPTRAGQPPSPEDMEVIRRQELRRDADIESGRVVRGDS